MSSAGNNCPRSGCNGILMPTQSYQFLCSNCRFTFVEQWFPRSTPPIFLATRPPAASLPSVSSGTSSTEFEPPNSRNHQDFETVIESLLENLDRLLTVGADAIIQHLGGNAADPDRRNGTNLSPAARSAVEALADVTVNEEISQLECSICHVKFVHGSMEVIKQMPCNHFYHENCILTWLNLTNTCPYCRHALPTHDPVSSALQNPGGSGSENPQEPVVSGSENIEAVPRYENRASSGSGSEINQAVSDDGNVGAGSGSVPGSEHE